MLNYDFARLTGMHSGSDINFQQLASALDCSRDFRGAGIIYADGAVKYLVRPSRRYSNPEQSLVTHVIITKVPLTNAESAENSLTDAISASSVATEIASAALSCGATILTGLVAFGGGVAVPFTGGASGALVALGYAGAVATAAQCVNGVYRVTRISSGNTEAIAWLDSQDWYVTTSTVLDVVSLAAAGGALKEALATYKTMKSASSARVMEWLRGISRQERARLTEAIIRNQNPGISNQAIKAAMRAGIYPKRFPTETLQNELRKQLVNAITSSASFAGSGISGTLRNPGNVLTSGKYLVGVLQSLPVMK
ncbi:hypothetical protein FJU30_16980 [Affinibrenneria salicis]|uniref:NAD synthetase n=2 Tax=Affinibrenneria salicis TaxID=2590031 RepID=A0A5J5FWN5_9GAMM|nr:hypothetical protein FJU30_16980 [Affinibrenneria salicis]